MFEPPTPASTDSSARELQGKAWAILDRNAALAQDIRTKARVLIQNAETPVDRNGRVKVRKADLEALVAAFDAEDAVWAHLSVDVP